MQRMIATVAVLALLLVCGSARAGEEPIRIGVSLGLTGRFAEEASMQRRGYELWQAHVNERGGILGRPVRVLVRDDRSDPAAARKLYADLIDREAVDLIFGPYSGTITQAVASLADARKYPMLVAGASADCLWEQGYRYVFGVFTPGSRYALGFLEILTEHDLREVAILTLDEPSPSAVAEGAGKWGTRLGLRIVHRETLAKEASDMVGALRRARSAGARAVLVAGYLEESIRAARALREIGWRPDAFFATVGPVLPGYQEALGTGADGTFSASQWVPHDHLPLAHSARFSRDFLRAYGETPSYQAASAYAAGQILAAAVHSAGALDRERIRDALATLNFTSLIGRYGVDQSGRQTRHFLLVLQWQRGKQEVVGPAELRTAAPLLGGSAEVSGRKGPRRGRR